MVRTLGTANTSNQVSIPGRRVAIGSTNAMNTTTRNISLPGVGMQSLPRDLSLELRDGGAPRLLQAFVPELQVLRRNHSFCDVAGESFAPAFGLQLEVLATFTVTVAGGGALAAKSDLGVAVLACADGSGEETRIGVDVKRQLLCIDGRKQGNPQRRCAPYTASRDAPDVVSVHAIVDRSVLEVIVNNISAITASVVASSVRCGGVRTYGVGEDVAARVEAWTLASANKLPAMKADDESAGRVALCASRQTQSLLVGWSGGGCARRRSAAAVWLGRLVPRLSRAS